MITIRPNEHTTVACFAPFQGGSIRPDQLKLPKDHRIVVPRFQESFAPEDINVWFHLNPRLLINIQCYAHVGRATFGVTFVRNTPFDLVSVSNDESIKSEVDFQTARAQIPCNATIDGHTFALVHFRPEPQERVVTLSFLFANTPTSTLKNMRLTTLNYEPARPYVEGLHEYCESLSPAQRSAFFKTIAVQIHKWSPEASDALESVLWNQREGT